MRVSNRIISPSELREEERVGAPAAAQVENGHAVLDLGALDVLLQGALLRGALHALKLQCAQRDSLSELFL